LTCILRWITVIVRARLVGNPISLLEITMRTRALRLLIALAAAAVSLTALSAPANAAPQSARGPICIPEAPVCYGIVGSPGTYRFSLRVSPPIQGGAVSFTVNGVPRGGSMTTHTSGTTLYLEYMPFPPLVSGDRACLTIFGLGTFCATTP
jgi:hypothetical protein